MSKVFNKKQLREFLGTVVGAAKNSVVPSSPGDVKSEPKNPANVSPVVDNNRKATDPSAEHKPRNKAEFKLATNTMIEDLPTDAIENTYKKVCAVLDNGVDLEQQKKDSAMKDRYVEEIVRAKVRKIIEAISSDESVHASDVNDTANLESIQTMLFHDIAARVYEEVLSGNITFDDPMAKHSATSLAALTAKKNLGKGAEAAAGNLATFPQPAKDDPMKPSISMVKQYVDKVGFKLQYIRDMDSIKLPGEDATELQIFIEEMVEEYIDYLAGGDLTREEVNELQQHPDIIADSPNFRRFLGQKIATLPESWPETSMPSFVEWVEEKYQEQTAQNKVDSAAKKARKLNKPDT